MPSVRAMQPREWRVMRRMRLAALQQDPYVFGLSYALAAALGKADWQRMITRGSPTSPTRTRAARSRAGWRSRSSWDG
jgi:hypothetical protein